MCIRDRLTESKRPKTYLFIRTNGGDNASLTYTKKMIWEMLELSLIHICLQYGKL